MRRAPRRPAAPSAPAHSGDEPCWLVTWRGALLAPEEATHQAAELGYRIMHRGRAGDVDFAQDEMLIRQLAAAPTAAVVVVVDGWEAPDKATRRFIEALRGSGDRERPVFVFVVCPSDGTGPQMLNIWRDRLALLEDPLVSVEAIVEAPHSRAAVAEVHG